MQDEKKIREIVREEIQRNYRSGTPLIAPHEHNETDNLSVGLSNIAGTDPVPYGNEKISNIFLYPGYGYASPNQMGPNQTILNNLTNERNINANKIRSTVPVPVIFDYSDTGFAGGNAEIGTIVIYQSLVAGVTGNAELWVMLVDGWHGVGLGLP